MQPRAERVQSIAFPHSTTEQQKALAKSPPNQSSGTKKQAAVLDTVHDLLLAIDRMSPGYQQGARLPARVRSPAEWPIANSPGWQIMVVWQLRWRFPMATRHLYMLGSGHVPVSEPIRAAAGGPSA
jgi:hypothetical protein